MKISTKGRYALRMVVDLAKNSEDSYISLKDIAQRQGISKKYLEQIVPLLSNNGILRTNRGNKGGYLLSKKPCDISVAEVIIAAEGTLAPISCLEYSPNDCPRSDECATLFMWEGLYKVVSDYLENISIQDIVDREKNNGGKK